MSVKEALQHITATLYVIQNQMMRTKLYNKPTYLYQYFFVKAVSTKVLKAKAVNDYIDLCMQRNATDALQFSMLRMLCKKTKLPLTKEDEATIQALIQMIDKKRTRWYIKNKYSKQTKIDNLPGNIRSGLYKAACIRKFTHKHILARGELCKHMYTGAITALYPNNIANHRYFNYADTYENKVLAYAGVAEDTRHITENFIGVPHENAIIFTNSLVPWYAYQNNTELPDLIFSKFLDSLLEKVSKKQERTLPKEV
jgi:hypothetical protein